MNIQIILKTSTNRARIRNESLRVTGKLSANYSRNFNLLDISRRAMDKPVGESNRRTLRPARPCHNTLNNVMSLLQGAHSSACIRLHTTTCNSLMTPECWTVHREWKSRLNGWSPRWLEGCMRVRRSLPASTNAAIHIGCVIKSLYNRTNTGTIV